MAIYLNQNSDNFVSYKCDDIFVDKSLLIRETNACMGKAGKKFMCVTRPRRFGKTLALSMLNAYYSKGCDSRELFKDLKIADDPSFEEYLNKHNVILIDMAEFYAYLDDPNDFLRKLNAEVVQELSRSYPDLDFSGLKLGEAIRLINSEKGERFIFLIDEWDVLYREQGSNAKLCDAYTEFLRGLFKSSRSSSCFDLVYMTGILPIRRYNTQSALNVFAEYNMLEPDRLAPLFGFTEEEVRELCAKHGMDFGEIKSWYDGYRLGGIEIYNPKSVATALDKGKCGDYWVATSAIEAITDYMNFDGGVLKGEIARMLIGEKVEIDPGKFGNDLSKVDSKDAALTVLVHLGYLAYLPPEIPGEKGGCYIPNEEIRKEFERALEKLDWKDIYDPIGNSMRLYEATFRGDLEEINASFDRNHEELASPFTKGDEKVLGVVAIASYYRVRNFYWVRKEETSMRGRSDISFFPKEPGHPPFIVELKIGKSPRQAISQIKKKAYWKAWEGYKGKVLLVGVSCEASALKHSSKVEWIEV